MAKSRITQAVETLQAELEKGQIASQDIVDAPDGIVLDTVSKEVVAPNANAFRVVFVSNIGPGVQPAYLAIQFDAVTEMGMAIPVGDRMAIPLGPDRQLNGVTNSATTKVTIQSFGSSAA